MRSACVLARLSPSRLQLLPPVREFALHKLNAANVGPAPWLQPIFYWANQLVRKGSDAEFWPHARSVESVILATTPSALRD